MQPAHDFAATLQFGEVAEVDAGKHTLRVRLPALENLLTDWLPMIAANAGGNRFYCLPDPGELVACVLDARGEGGVVLGAIYNTADPTPAASRDIWCKQFANGTRIEHDRSSGNVLVHTAGTVTVDAPATVCTGNLTVQGSLTYLQGMSGYGSAGGAAATIAGSIKQTGGDVVTDGDVVATGKSLRDHTHIDSIGGKTSAPQ